MYNFRTDLADERAQICKEQFSKKDLDGIETENED